MILKARGSWTYRCEVCGQQRSGFTTQKDARDALAEHDARAGHFPERRG